MDPALAAPANPASQPRTSPAPVIVDSSPESASPSTLVESGMIGRLRHRFAVEIFRLRMASSFSEIIPSESRSPEKSSSHESSSSDLHSLPTRCDECEEKYQEKRKWAAMQLTRGLLAFNNNTMQEEYEVRRRVQNVQAGRRAIDNGRQNHSRIWEQLRKELDVVELPSVQDLSNPEPVEDPESEEEDQWEEEDEGGDDVNEPETADE
ncbi:MAG: hypothetical protein M1826_001789 [Phylliscum demangeonii]|nr:MAG: hypothetical protein M1826_001789 [Phylliscum demangeonii]